MISAALMIVVAGLLIQAFAAASYLLFLAIVVVTLVQFRLLRSRT